MIAGRQKKIRKNQRIFVCLSELPARLKGHKYLQFCKTFKHLENTLG